MIKACCGEARIQYDGDYGPGGYGCNKQINKVEIISATIRIKIC